MKIGEDAKGVLLWLNIDKIIEQTELVELLINSSGPLSCIGYAFNTRTAILLKGHYQAKYLPANHSRVMNMIINCSLSSTLRQLLVAYIREIGVFFCLSLKLLSTELMHQ